MKLHLFLHYCVRLLQLCTPSFIHTFIYPFPHFFMHLLVQGSTLNHSRIVLALFKCYLIFHSA